MNIQVVRDFLSQSHWGKKRSLPVIENTVQSSVCFSLYQVDHQIGFDRVVTDFSTFGYLADIIIHEKHRGKGMGKWPTETIVNDERWCTWRRRLGFRLRRIKRASAFAASYGASRGINRGVIRDLSTIVQYV